jgi:DNA topoisomerase-3
MEVAEKLYNKGMLSYPRTETDKFPASMNMQNIVRELATNTTKGKWGKYCKELLNTKKQLF